MRHGSLQYGLMVGARSILLGWAALFAITFLVVRPVLLLTAHLLDASWAPTSELALQCMALVAAGWIIGRWDRSHPVIAALIFAAMLGVWNFDLTPGINLPWLFQLTVDTFGSSRYLESLATVVITHALLFGSLFTGVRLGHPKQQPLSIGAQADKPAA